MTTFSIIIPAYNVENYIERCILSIVNQHFSNCEIIVVDDGSRDKTSQIISDYSRKFKRFRVISHNQNLGLSAARNSGLDHAEGEYVWFVDADDFILPGSLQFLSKIIGRENPDIVCFGFKKGLSKKNCEIPKETIKRVKYEILDVKTCLRLMLSQKIISNSANDKIFKRSILKARFPVGLYFEDLATIPYIFLENNRLKIIYTQEKLYVYTLEEKSSITRSKFTEKHLDLITVASKLEEYLKTNFPELAVYGFSRKYSAYIETVNRILRSYDTLNLPPAFNKCVDFIRKELINYLINGKSPIKLKIEALLIALLGKHWGNIYTTYRRLRNV